MRIFFATIFAVDDDADIKFFSQNLMDSISGDVGAVFLVYLFL